MNITWYIDNSLPDCRKLIKSCKYNNIDYILCNIEDLKDDGIIINDCSIAWGSIKFVSFFQKYCANETSPGTYFELDKLSYIGFSPYYGDLLLNKNFILLPFNEVLRRNKSLLKQFDGAMFIRPNESTKLFTGFVLNNENYDHEINSLTQIQKPYPDTLCVLSPEIKLKSEFRYWIVNRQVITYSEYSFYLDGLEYSEQSPPIECNTLASIIANREWQPDIVYTVDIGITTDNEIGIIEFNSFSSSGLYASNTNDIVKYVSEIAYKEFLGEDIDLCCNAT